PTPATAQDASTVRNSSHRLRIELNVKVRATVRALPTRVTGRARIDASANSFAAPGTSSGVGERLALAHLWPRTEAVLGSYLTALVSATTITRPTRVTLAIEVPMSQRVVMVTEEYLDEIQATLSRLTDLVSQMQENMT